MDATSDKYLDSVQDYHRIEQAIHFIEANYRSQPSLAEVANFIGLSEFHFQRLFKRWVGISPKRFLQYLTKEYAKKMLEMSNNILDTTYQAGLTSPGRLHDLFVTYEALTPGEYKNKGEGVEIIYGFHSTPFGQCLIGVTSRGVCHLSFLSDSTAQIALNKLIAKWKFAKFYSDPKLTENYIEKIFNWIDGKPDELIPVYFAGTGFQLKVWEALISIPVGNVVTYQDIAQTIDSPLASRAVGNAVSLNPIAYLIPCHRVIRKAGDYGEYRWGSARKKAILGWEFAYRESITDA